MIQPPDEPRPVRLLAHVPGHYRVEAVGEPNGALFREIRARQIKERARKRLAEIGVADLQPAV